MRFAVLGMGGVGGLIAGSLARGGDDVAAIVRPAALARYPSSIEVAGPEAVFSAPVRPVSSVAGPLDVLWIATKATQLEGALAEIRDASQIGAIVPLLNGIEHVAMLRARFGAERVVAATITVESERVAPGGSRCARASPSSASRPPTSRAFTGRSSGSRRPASPRARRPTRRRSCGKSSSFWRRWR
jgi:2-dehydropantoate 2-reductase